MANISYIGSIYEPSPLITSLHASPRFGHSNSMVDLFYNDTRTDYIRGLLFVSAFVFVIFFIWLIIVLLLKCCGEKRVGCLSGVGFRQSQSKSEICRINWTRYIFMFCGVLLITSCTLFSMKGVDMVDVALKSIQDSSDDISMIANQTYTVLTKLDNVGNQAVPLRDSTVKVLDSNLCPNKYNLMSTLDAIGNDIVIPGVDNTSSYDLRDNLHIINQVEKGAVQIIEYLEILNNFILGLITNFETTYAQFIDKKDDVDYVLDEIQSNTKWLAYLVLPVGIFAFIFSFGTSLVWKDKSSTCFQKLQSWILLPLFLLMIILFVIVGLVIYPSGIVNSDFCLGADGLHITDNNTSSGVDDFINRNTTTLGVNNMNTSLRLLNDSTSNPSPEASIMAILRATNIYNIDYSIIKYYIEGCRNKDPFADIRIYEQNLTNTRNQLTNFTNLLTNRNLLPQLEVSCQRNYTSVLTMLRNFTDVIDILRNFTGSALDLVNCQHVNKIYVSFVHDTTCRDVPTGITWMFATFIIISVCGVVMITLRSAWGDTAGVENNNTFIIERGWDGKYNNSPVKRVR